MPFSHGELTINRLARQLEYRVSFGQMAFILGVFSVAAVAAMLKSGAPMLLMALAVALIWLWFGGLNVWIGRARFERFLGETIDAAPVLARNRSNMPPPHRADAFGAARDLT